MNILYYPLLLIIGFFFESQANFCIANVNSSSVICIDNGALCLVDKKQIKENQNKLSDFFTKKCVIKDQDGNIITDKYHFLAVGNSVSIDNKLYIPAITKRFFLRDRIVLLKADTNVTNQESSVFTLYDIAPGHNTQVKNIQFFEIVVGQDATDYYIVTSSTFPTVKWTKAFTKDSMDKVTINLKQDQQEFKHYYLIGFVGKNVLYGQKREKNNTEITIWELTEYDDLLLKDFKSHQAQKNSNNKNFFYQQEEIESIHHLDFFVHFPKVDDRINTFQKLFLQDIKDQISKMKGKINIPINYCITGNKQELLPKVFFPIRDSLKTALANVEKDLLEQQDRLNKAVQNRNFISLVESRMCGLLYNVNKIEKNEIKDICIDIDNQKIYKLYLDSQKKIQLGYQLIIKNDFVKIKESDNLVLQELENLDIKNELKIRTFLYASLKIKIIEKSEQPVSHGEAGGEF